MRKVVVRPRATENEHGETTPDPGRTITILAIYPASTDEVTVGGQTVTEDLIMLTKSRDRLATTDQVVYLGDVYEVDGKPAALEDNGRIEAWQVRLKRGEG